MQFQRGMWAEAWVQSIAARKFVALVVAGELAIQLSMEWFDFAPSEDLTSAELLAFIISSTFASTFVSSYLAYAVHARILLPLGRSTFTDHARVLGLAARGFAIAVIIWSAVMGVGLIPALFPAIKEFLVARPDFVMLLVFWMLLLIAIVGLPLFVWLGMSLPAYVVERAGGLGAAFRRSKAQFGWIAGRLLIGPIFLTALLFVPDFLLPIPSKYIGSIWSEKGIFQTVAVLWSLLNYTVFAFSVSLTAVILSRAFIRAEGMSDPTAA